MNSGTTGDAGGSEPKTEGQTPDVSSSTPQ